jgi:hypothetical protein
MNQVSNPSSSVELEQIIESAQRLGVEIDEEEALQWLTAIAAAKGSGDDLHIDAQSGVFGHKVTMLDFSPDDLAHFRKIGRLVEFEDQPGVVETALASPILAARPALCWLN